MDPHELVSRRVLPLDRRNVRVADPRQSPVRRFDLLTRGGRGDAEDLVERGRGHLRRDEIRRRGGLIRSASGAGGEGSRRLEAYTWQRLGERRGGE